MQAFWQLSAARIQFLLQIFLLSVTTSYPLHTHTYSIVSTCVIIIDFCYHCGLADSLPSHVSLFNSFIIMIIIVVVVIIIIINIIICINKLPPRSAAYFCPSHTHTHTHIYIYINILCVSTVLQRMDRMTPCIGERQVLHYVRSEEVPYIKPCRWHTWPLSHALHGHFRRLQKSVLWIH